MNDQRTHKYLTTETPNNSFIGKKKSRNPNICHSTKTNQKKREKTALAAHPQNLPALHPKLDLQLIQQNNTTVTIYHLTDLSWS